MDIFRINVPWIRCREPSILPARNIEFLASPGVRYIHRSTHAGLHPVFVLVSLLLPFSLKK